MIKSCQRQKKKNPSHSFSVPISSSLMIVIFGERWMKVYDHILLVWWLTVHSFSNPNCHRVHVERPILLDQWSNWIEFCFFKILQLSRPFVCVVLWYVENCGMETIVVSCCGVVGYDWVWWIVSELFVGWMGEGWSLSSSHPPPTHPDQIKSILVSNLTLLWALF